MGRDARHSVIGSDGKILTMENLPQPHTARWIPRKKAEIVAAVRGGLLSFEEACDRYALTSEEFSSWQIALDHFGLEGLQTTHLAKHRHAHRHLIVNRRDLHS
jgi:Protein of unknown function (DUF1153)